MHSLFLVCLAGGLGATALLALFGGLAGHGGHSALHPHTGHGPASLPAAHGHLALPSDGQVHAAAHMHVDGPQVPADAGGQGQIAAMLGWTMSWLSPLALASAALWFGAGGLIADLAVPAAAGPIAIVAAVAGAAIVHMLMAAFVRADTLPLSADATGAVGVLSAAIRPDAAGEVIYVLEGLHRSAAAKSLDGAPLPRGTSVVIVRRERGIAYVSALDPLSPLAEGSWAGLPSDEPGPEHEKKGLSE